MLSFESYRRAVADATDSSAYVNSAAHADLLCGPGSAKIAIKHFFSNATAMKEVGYIYSGF